LPNSLYVVGKRQTVLTGRVYSNVRGFDYEDEATGLTLNVRDGSTEIRICGILLDIKTLLIANKLGR
jgi:hypothetical protein